MLGAMTTPTPARHEREEPILPMVQENLRQARRHSYLPRSDEKSTLARSSPQSFEAHLARDTKVDRKFREIN